MHIYTIFNLLSYLLSRWDVFFCGTGNIGNRLKKGGFCDEDLGEIGVNPPILAIAVVLIDAFSKLVCGDKVHQLGKDRFPVIHVQAPFLLIQETRTSEK